MSETRRKLSELDYFRAQAILATKGYIRYELITPDGLDAFHFKCEDLRGREYMGYYLLCTNLDDLSRAHARIKLRRVSSTAHTAGFSLIWEHYE